MQFSKYKIVIANAFPFAARMSRLIKAFTTVYSKTRLSYSQHGEDVFVWDLLNKHFPNTRYNYVDVGAFHPTLLSNTYLFYRKNINGITVEPNHELAGLHKFFRSKDIQLEIACGNLNQLSVFHLQKTFPALSSLNNISNKGTVTCHYVPVFNLDTVCGNLGCSKIYFLSIDVEGFDFQVLQGANNILTNTFIVCIECNSKESEDCVTCFLREKDFIFIGRFSCNLIFRNEKFNDSIAND